MIDGSIISGVTEPTENFLSSSVINFLLYVERYATFFGLIANLTLPYSGGSADSPPKVTMSAAAG